MTPPPQIIGRTQCTPNHPVGLYLHWPYCETKCGYCDFYSVPLDGRDPAPMAQALCQELSWRLDQPGAEIASVFFGGGTPTTLATEHLATVLAAIRSAVGTGRNVEFTVEANPATVDAAKAQALVDAGVNRVSLGAQSFHARELAFLERLHSPNEVHEAVAVLHRAGLTNLNLDLIFGIPGQTLAGWQETLARTLALEPSHVACYGLTYEPGTSLTRQLRTGTVRRCDETLEHDLYLAAVETLTGAGFAHYEISNFAQPDLACAHNLIYWRCQPCLAIGPSATGFTGAARYKNVAGHHEYTRRVLAGEDPAQDFESVDRETLALELLLMGMRLHAGLAFSEFAQRTGTDLRVAAQASLERLAASRLIACDEHGLRLTETGRLVADGVIAELALALDPAAGGALPVVQTQTAPPR
jgi:oxygen-independent coproporphyrinogen-3 oxidase